MNELLRVIPPVQRSLVRAKGNWLSADVRAWSAPVHHHLGLRLYDTLGLAAAATAPTVRRRQLAVLVRYGAWIYLLDDRLDAPDVSLAEIREIGRSLVEVIHGRSIPVEDDFLGHGLAGILADLHQCNHADVLIDSFKVELLDGIGAAVEHAEASRLVAAGELAAPTAESYLDLASSHINYRSLAMGLVLVLGEYPSRWALERLAEALRPAGRAVRLANDLRTAPKDASEGSLNVLNLRTRDGLAVTPELAVQWIVEDSRAHRDVLHAIAGREMVTTCKVLANSLRIAVGAYRLADLKQDDPWSHRMIAAWSAASASAPDRVVRPARGRRSSSDLFVAASAD